GRLYLKQGEDSEDPPWTVVGLNEGLVYLHNARHSLEEQCTVHYLLYLKQGEDCEYPPWTVVGLNEGLVYLHNARHSLEEQG
ncbi:MAG: hypothetical protein ACK559_02965, partial [bacterium]